MTAPTPKPAASTSQTAAKPQPSKRVLPSKAADGSEWYLAVIEAAKLADYSEVKGAMIIRPNGYALWEKVQEVLDGWFKASGVRNAYFPLFIPYSLLEREKAHVSGFSPELALVTIAGGETLSEPYVVRPTSETIMYRTFADWIHSYRDLPLKLNQWCNVVRWEKRTFPFLRTSEFLWQEGHTVHSTAEEALDMTHQALEWYTRFHEEYFAISVYAGRKSNAERFAGAHSTFSVEVVLPDGKALQAATSHYLADNFAKVFNIAFSDQNGSETHPHQTSWGLSTRSIGGLIFSHGDDNGLVLPPRVAPVQVVILTIGNRDAAQQTTIAEKANEIAGSLSNAGVRVVVDSDAEHSMGYRINEWEVQGVPLRLELGAKEVDNGAVSAVRRDTFERSAIKMADLAMDVPVLLERIQADLLERSRALRDSLTTEIGDYEAFKRIMAEDRKFIRAYWCGDPACEASIKEETKATTRVLEADAPNGNGTCVYCGKPARERWLFAQSY